jgi:flagellar hook-basal body complex protein FliE
MADETTTSTMFASDSGTSSPAGDSGGDSGGGAWENGPIGGANTAVDNSVSTSAGDVNPPDTNTVADDANSGGATETGQQAPVQQTAQPDKPASAITEGMRQYAKAMGFGDTDIEAFPSDEALGSAVAAFGRRILSAQPQAGSQDQNAGQQPGQQPQPPQQPQQPQQPHPMNNQFKAQVDLGAFDEDTQKVIGGLNDHVANTFGQFAQVMQTMVQRVVESQRATNALLEQHHLGQLGQFISGNEDYSAVVGNDTAVRRSLMNDARIIGAQLARNGITPDPEVVFRTAIAARFGDALGKRTKEKVHQDIRQAEEKLRNNTAGNGATRRQTVTQARSNPRDEVVASVKEILAR